MKHRSSATIQAHLLPFPGNTPESALITTATSTLDGTQATLHTSYRVFTQPCNPTDLVRVSVGAVVIVYTTFIYE